MKKNLLNVFLRYWGHGFSSAFLAWVVKSGGVGNFAVRVLWKPSAQYPPFLLKKFFDAPQAAESHHTNDYTDNLVLYA